MVCGPIKYKLTVTPLIGPTEKLCEKNIVEIYL